MTISCYQDKEKKGRTQKEVRLQEERNNVRLPTEQPHRCGMNRLLSDSFGLDPGDEFDASPVGGVDDHRVTLGDLAREDLL